MKVPVKWLKEYVATDLSAGEIARRMTMAGLEAESIEHIGETWENVFVGEVERVDPHPDADRLTLPVRRGRRTSNHRSDRRAKHRRRSEGGTGASWRASC